MLRRMLIVAALLQTTLLAAGPTTGPYTATTYDDACKQLRERGFPATIDDLQPAPIPDDKNGAVFLKRAADAIVPDDSGPRSSSLEYGPGLPYGKEWFALAEKSERANAAALDLVRKARACGDSISWDVPANAAPAERMQKILKGLSGIRGLANVVNDEALLEHFRGNDAAAFERALDARYLVQASGRRPFLVSTLVTMGLRAMLAENYRLMAVDVHIADQGARNEKPVDRQTVKDAIAWLSDDAKIRDAMRRVMADERVYGLSDAKVNGIAAMPAWQADLPSVLALYDDLASQMEVPFWKPMKLPNAPKGAYKAMYDVIIPPIDRFRTSMSRIELDQRMAAVSLAVALYHHDKNAFPKTIEDLVPDYLPRLPIDPYSRDGEPLMYHVLADGKRPRLGSVGPDGLDGQMEDEAPAAGRYDLNFSSRGGGAPDDVWIDLASWPAEGGK